MLSLPGPTAALLELATRPAGTRLVAPHLRYLPPHRLSLTRRARTGATLFGEMPVRASRARPHQRLQPLRLLCR